MARLSSVPEVAPRAIGMIRVSKERDGMISPDVQRVAIEDYARARGYVVTRWVEGLDESGSRSRSAWWARLDAAVEAVEARECDVVVVWKFSRTARHRLKWAVAIDRVEAAGGRLESATEQVDTSTSTGRFTRGMLAELNAFEAERIGEVWKEVQASRVAAGKTPTGLPKYGYEYDPVAKLHRPDPVAGPMLASLYERYTAGESWMSLVGWMNERRHLTVRGGLWSANSLRRVMDAGFGAGLVRYHQEFHEGIHEPLISREVWQRYLDARAARTKTPPRVLVSKYLLTGIIECGTCGGAMSGNVGARGYADYRCGLRKTRGPEACSETSTSLAFIEGKVFGWLERLAATGLDERAQVRAEAQLQRSSAEAEVRRLMGEVGKIDESVERINLLVAEGHMLPGDYSSTRASLEERRAHLVALAEEQGRLSRRREDHVQVAATLMQDWEDIGLAERRHLLRDVVGRVRVSNPGRAGQTRGNGRSGAVVEVRPIWSEEWERL